MSVETRPYIALEVTPYFALDERYPGLIGVRADGDEYETAYVSKHELTGVMRENAELRELVRVLCYCNQWDSDCDRCAMNDAEMHVAVRGTDFCDGLRDRIRELGMEVDG